MCIRDRINIDDENESEFLIDELEETNVNENSDSEDFLWLKFLL